ncbi:hypothetical protein [Roseateles aquatilis]|nr:hypothetical protein [Roseateles aquatilis]
MLPSRPDPSLPRKTLGPALRGKFIQQEQARWAQLIQEARITPDL